MKSRIVLDKSCIIKSHNCSIYFIVIGCTDRNNNCASWARTGECQRNPGYMLSYCRRSCNHCSSSSEPGDVTGGNDGMYEWKIYDKMKKKTALYREQFQHLITETETKSIPQHIDTTRPLINYPFVHFLFDHCIGCPSLNHVL